MNREADIGISQAISPIVTNTYGDNGMARALVAYLEDLVLRDDFDSRGREYGLMLACWDMFPGGVTAELVAKEVERVLLVREGEQR